MIAARVTSGSGYTVGATRDASVNIADDDDPPSLSVSSSPGDEESTGGGMPRPVSFTIGLSEPSGFTITVDYESSDGTAMAPADYTAATGTITIPPYSSTKTVRWRSRMTASTSWIMKPSICC